MVGTPKLSVALTGLFLAISKLFTFSLILWINEEGQKIFGG